MNDNNETTLADRAFEGQGKVPDEREEMRMKAIFFKFLKEQIPFEGNQELVTMKIRELACGLYDIYIANKHKK